MIVCLSCGARTDNGLALCELCQRGARQVFEHLPIFFRNLARWRRPARPNGSLGARSQWLLRRGETGEADRIGSALDKAGNMLTTWARTLSDQRGIDVPTGDDEAAQATALCAWFDQHLTTIATVDWAGEFVRDLLKHVARLEALTDTAVPGWYAGACRRCGARVYVVPGLTWVTCRAMVRVVDDEGKERMVDVGCGTITFARDHLDTLLDEARDWVAPPMRIAEAIVALIDTEQSIPQLHKRISKWGERGMVKAVDRLGYVRELDYAGEKYAPKRYRLGDVLDGLLVTAVTRRLDDPMASS